LTLDQLSAFFERVTALPAEKAPPIESLALHVDMSVPLSEAVVECFGGFPDTVRLISRRLAELHIALAADREWPEFAPEEFSAQYQRSFYQSMRKLVSDTLYQLMLAKDGLAMECQPLCNTLIRDQSQFDRRFQWLANRPIESQRIRCHGDCHLAQILFSGKDFVFIDFEGSPLQSLGERRIKRSPIRDVASVMRSFDYAAQSALRGLTNGRGRPVGAVRPEDFPQLSAWANFWSRSVQHTFVTTYQAHTRDASFSPPSTDEFDRLLNTFLLERMLIELEYELTYRPAWVILPIQRLAESLTPNVTVASSSL
jgi:maltose alpha-D-glucosyltransferase/alpha-amylase